MLFYISNRTSRNESLIKYFARLGVVAGSKLLDMANKTVDDTDNKETYLGSKTVG